jgi:hypothetical protein
MTLQIAYMVFVESEFQLSDNDIFVVDTDLQSQLDSKLPLVNRRLFMIKMEAEIFIEKLDVKCEGRVDVWVKKVYTTW